MSALLDLRNHWSAISKRMRQAKSLGVMAAFEGVHVPSEETAGADGRRGRYRTVLETISGMDRATVMVHGSPSVGDLTALLGIDRVVGHRGLEIKDPQGKEIRYYGPRDVRLVNTLSEELVRQTDHLAVHVKRMGPAVRLDYRKADPSQIPDFLDAFRSVVNPFNPLLTLEHGPGIVDARIRCACDEVTALRFIHRRLLRGTVFLYFGDNSTVHDGLRQLRPVGVLVNVEGMNPGSADFMIPGSQDVVDVLDRIGADWRATLQESP